MFDIIRLDPESWKPTDVVVRQYSTLIWSERFDKDSDFELTTYLVDETLKQLPLWSLISLRQSKEVMMVEKHAIATDEFGVKTLTVKGTSLTSYFDYRSIGEKSGVKYPAMTKSAIESILILLYNAFVNTQAFDLTTGLAAYYKNPRDAIPNCVITDSTEEHSSANQGPSLLRWLDPGSVRSALVEFIGYRPYGFRMLRPESPGYVVTVAQNQTVSRVYTPNITKVAFDVYRGTDRSIQALGPRALILDVAMDDLNAPNYLFGTNTVYNEVHVCLPTRALAVTRGVYSGIYRRVLHSNVGQPAEGWTETAWETFNEAMAQITVNSAIETVMIEGEVSKTSEKIFEIDYNLGDIISLRGDYGVTSRCRVIEYIRTYDKGAVLNYPTLAGL